MSDMWDDATWNEDGELVADIYTEPSDDEHDTDDDFDDEPDNDDTGHTYATIDCGGDCGHCIALIVDGDVISGPPFHPNCNCTLNSDDIENAKYHKSHLHHNVAPDTNVDMRDVEWLKESLNELDYYEPDEKAGESAEKLNPYPNQRLFDAIEKFRKLHKIKENGAVKPGHWTEVKINEELKKKTNSKQDNSMKNIITNELKKDILRFEGLKQNFYLDSKGVLTIGIGQNVSNFNKFKNLDLSDKQTMKPLNMIQKVKLYSQIMQDISDGTFKEKKYSNIEISADDIYHEFDNMLEKSYAELVNKIDNFSALPISVQQALVDMQFNMGNEKFSDRTWPNLFNAIKNNDWKTAANEASQRKDVQQTRREWTYKMFLNAN